MNGEDFCQICYTETLDQAPSIELQCGHIFHFDCVLSKVNSGYAGHRYANDFFKYFSNTHEANFSHAVMNFFVR